jgi:hypothetical protein
VASLLGFIRGEDPVRQNFLLELLAALLAACGLDMQLALQQQVPGCCLLSSTTIYICFISW